MLLRSPLLEAFAETRRVERERNIAVLTRWIKAAQMTSTSNHEGMVLVNGIKLAMENAVKEIRDDA